MKRVVVALGCVLLAGPVLAQSMGEKTGVNSALGVAPTTDDFVKEVAISDMFEIASNKLGEQKGNSQIIRAQVPLSDMFGYATDLRSRTQGRATYTMQFDSYQEVPNNIATEIVKRVRGE